MGKHSHVRIEGCECLVNLTFCHPDHGAAGQHDAGFSHGRTSHQRQNGHERLDHRLHQKQALTVGHNGDVASAQSVDQVGKVLSGIDQDHDVLSANRRPLVVNRDPFGCVAVPHPCRCLMKQCVEAVSEQFMFKMNRRSVRVLKGVHSDVQVRRHFTDGPGNGKKPLQHTAVFGRSCGTQTLRFRMPISGKGVIARTEHFVKHVVHGLHQVVAGSVV